LIRQATATDRAALQRLYEQMRPGEAVKVIASRLEEINESPQHALFVHETDEKVDGTVFLSLIPDPLFGSLPFAVADHLFIASAADEAVHHRLLHAVEEYAREQRCTRVVWIHEKTTCPQ